LRKTRTIFTERRFLKWLFSAFFIIITFVLCFSTIKVPLEPWDEFTNVQVIQETLKSGQFLTLEYKGEHFFEKPPLWYWLTMGATQLFGQNATSYRIVSASAGFCLCLAFFFIGARQFSYKSGFVAGCSFLAIQHLFFVNDTIFSTHRLNSADLDSLQLLFIVLSFGAFCEVHYNSADGRGKRIWIIIAAVLSALAFLTKGPAALLVPFTYFLYQGIVLIKKSLKSLPKKIVIISFLKEFFLFFIFFLLIAAPWHLLMIFTYKRDFVDTYFLYHLVKRSIFSLEEHGENMWFYFRIFARPDFFVSGELFLSSVMVVVLYFRSKIFSSFKLLGIIASVLIAGFMITFSQTKLSWYIFPLYPFVCFCIGIAFGISEKISKEIKILFIALFSISFVKILVTIGTFFPLSVAFLFLFMAICLFVLLKRIYFPLYQNLCLIIIFTQLTFNLLLSLLFMVRFL
jgi:4-amino-4-deoxy-L-arabinose transferase-like glycosyltransferase